MSLAVATVVDILHEEIFSSLNFRVQTCLRVGVGGVAPLPLSYTTDMTVYSVLQTTQVLLALNNYWMSQKLMFNCEQGFILDIERGKGSK